jgi:hypothetical protein
MNMNSPNNVSANAADNMLWRRHTENVRHTQAGGVDAPLRAEYREVIEKALNAEPEGLQVMEAEQIRTELQGGQLDTPAAVRVAARNIMLFGI